MPKDSVKCPFADRKIVKPTKAPDSSKWIFETKVIIDKETLEPTVELSKRDLDKEIQSYKDECGMAFVLRQIAAGRMSIRDLADDGKGGVDALGLPETVNEACQANILAQEAGKAAAAELGLKAFTEEELAAFVNNEIKKAQEGKTSQANTQEENK